MQFILPLILVAVIMLPLFVYYRQVKTGKKLSSGKKALVFNLVGFAVVCLTAFVLPVGGFVSAASTGNTSSGLGFIAAAIATGLATIGAGVAVASGSAAAIGATTEDPKVLGKALLFVGLGEGIALYGLLISIMILNKI